MFDREKFQKTCALMTSGTDGLARGIQQQTKAPRLVIAGMKEAYRLVTHESSRIATAYTANEMWNYLEMLVRLHTALQIVSNSVMGLNEHEAVDERYAFGYLSVLDAYLTMLESLMDIMENNCDCGNPKCGQMLSVPCTCEQCMPDIEDVKRILGEEKMILFAFVCALMFVCLSLPFVLYWVVAELNSRYDYGYTAGWDDCVWHSQMYDRL